MKYTLLICICFVLSISKIYAVENIYLHSLDKRDGLSQQSVMTISQDGLGRMWFGTLEGINRYDGEEIVNFRPDSPFKGSSSLLSNQIYDMVRSPEGDIFFTSDKILYKYDIRKEQFIRLRDNTISALHASDEGIWMTARDTVYQWIPEDNRFDYLFSIGIDHGNIHQLYRDKDKRFWLGTGRGLFRLASPQQGEPIQTILANAYINSLFEDSRGNMWVSLFRNGIYRITNDVAVKYDTTVANSLVCDNSTCFAEDDLGNIWVGTTAGLDKIDTEMKFTHYGKSDLPGGLKDGAIFSLYKDEQGTIWAGAFWDGVYYVNPERSLYHHYVYRSGRDDCLGTYAIGKMVEDKRQDIWICTEGGGLERLNRKTGRFTRYRADAKPGSLTYDNLTAIVYDEKRDCLYVGNSPRGVTKFDIETESATTYPEADSYNTILQMSIHGDSLLVLSVSDMFILDLRTGISYTLLKPGLQLISYFIDIEKEELWISGWSDIRRINLKNPEEVHLYTYGKKGLGQFQINCIAKDLSGNILVGTNGNGIFQYDEISDRFCAMETNWIQCNYYYCMVLSEQGNLVMLGDMGITMLNSEKQLVKTISCTGKEDFPILDHGCDILLCKDGEVFVSGRDGIVSFKESRFFETPPSYDLYFSSLHVNNKLIQPGNSDILSTSLSFVEQVDLKYNQNNLVVAFTDNNYVQNINRCMYEYKLEGFDKEWNVSEVKNVRYTNLNPGNYTLLVREKEPIDGEFPKTIRLRVVVHTPWYASGWAWLIYVFIVTSVAYLLIRNRYTKRMLQLSLEHEKQEKEKQKEITQAKIQFFSNISHEFRTPLTLIVSQVEMLLLGNTLTPILRNRLSNIYKNTYQLRELLSELLDFRKMERKGFKLRISRQPLLPFLKNICRSFQEQASWQGIELRLTTSVNEETCCWFDARQLKKVYSNLFSNALKYTSEQGVIEVIAEETTETVLVRVTDSGCGIAQEELPFIFDRFYQGKKLSNTQGTGIGLSLVKGIVEMHRGTIEVQSAPEYGSIFTVTLPKQNLLEENEYISFVDEPEAIPFADLPRLSLQDEPVKEETTVENNSRTCILVVEDNEELLRILTSLLSPIYRVIVALNGQEGFEKAMAEHPDLIISDIMMPLMTGTEMCRKIKNHFDLYHIPVILLTALVSEDKNIEGLQCGADDYIEKPFNNKLLLNRIANLLHNRKLLKQFYNSIQTDCQKTPEFALTATDREFLEQVNTIIETYLGDTDFDVDTLASEMGVSRSSLYKKLKTLSNMSPNEFILNVKLNRAVYLLKHNPEIQITEIAYQLGFGSLRHFRNCFKEKFGKSPQEYRNK